MSTDAEKFYNTLLAAHSEKGDKFFEAMKPFIVLAHIDGKNTAKKKRNSLGVYGWGGVLLFVCIFISVAVYASFRCTFGANVGENAVGEIILSGCPRPWMTAIYMIMKDWGSGIGIVGAGAGLAWSTFYKG